MSTRLVYTVEVDAEGRAAYDSLAELCDTFQRITANWSLFETLDTSTIRKFDPEVDAGSADSLVDRSQRPQSRPRFYRNGIV